MVSYEQLKEGMMPCIVHWNQNHFVVVISFLKGRRVKVADPAKGIIVYKKDEFLEQWISNSASPGETEGKGIALLLEPSPSFYELEGEKRKTLSWSLVLQYLNQSRWRIMQVLAALLFSSLVQLIFPFLTQSIVDTGINAHNLQYVTLVLIAQLMLTLSKTMV